MAMDNPRQRECNLAAKSAHRPWQPYNWVRMFILRYDGNSSDGHSCHCYGERMKSIVMVCGPRRNSTRLAEGGYSRGEKR